MKDSHINTQSKKEMIDILKKGADSIIHLGTGVYDETLQPTSIFISGDRAWGLINHHVALPFDKPTYNVFLNYELGGHLTIIRSKPICGKGKYGTIFGLPNCQSLAHYKFYEWVAIDSFIGSKERLTPKMIVDKTIKIKIRITTKDFTIITEPSIVISYNHNPGSEFSIRTQRIGIPHQIGLGIANIEITNNVLKISEMYLKEGTNILKVLQCFGVCLWKKNIRKFLILK